MANSTVHRVTQPQYTTSLPYSWDVCWQNEQLCGNANKTAVVQYPTTPAKRSQKMTQIRKSKFQHFHPLGFILSLLFSRISLCVRKQSIIFTFCFFRSIVQFRFRLRIRQYCFFAFTGKQNVVPVPLVCYIRYILIVCHYIPKCVRSKQI